MAIEFAQRIGRIPVYPVADAYELGGDVAMLASNESCFGPLPEVVEAARATLTGTNRYPDPSYSALRAALSERYGVARQRIALGNGSCDVLLAAGEALLEPGAEVVYSWPAFSVYPHLAAASGARAIEVPLDDQERHDLEAMAREVTVATRLVLVCNPNNPTSTAVDLAQVEALLEAVPAHVCVILDEAYVEFSLAVGDPEASVELLSRHSNLVLLRTFSKVYGLAGLRVGYALCGSESFRTAVDQVRQPFYLGVAAQAAAVEALAHQDEVERRVTRTISSRLSLEEGTRGSGCWVAESDANFIWVALPDGSDEAEVVRQLAERRVIVRAGAALGREGRLRVTVGTEAENQRFVAALGEVLGLTTPPRTVDPVRDQRIDRLQSLVSPQDLLDELPLGDERTQAVVAGRGQARAVIHGQDDRLLVVVGPCSVHDPQATLEYAGRLSEQASRLEQDLLVTMRVYFEKPRTTTGWKGLINDPHLDDSGDVNSGLRLARQVLLGVLSAGLPAGCEFLDPFIPQYISDAVCWGAIGARTVESQTHRQLGSGLSMPVGFKNRTDGNVQVAADALRAAAVPQAFAGISRDGVPAVLYTRGNPDCHVILRGGQHAPNYGGEDVASARAVLRAAGVRERVMIDCSHDNSGKDASRQPAVASDVAGQMASGNGGIIGVMLESFLVGGRQRLDSSPLVYGQSITDACLDWERTVEVLEELARAVRARRCASPS